VDGHQTARRRSSIKDQGPWTTPDTEVPETCNRPIAPRADPNAADPEGPLPLTVSRDYFAHHKDACRRR
jgi:hypothetical protein